MVRCPLLALLLVGSHGADLAAPFVFLGAYSRRDRRVRSRGRVKLALTVDFAAHLNILDLAELFAEGLFEVLESEHDHGDIV